MLPLYPVQSSTLNQLADSSKLLICTSLLKMARRTMSLSPAAMMHLLISRLVLVNTDDCYVP